MKLKNSINLFFLIKFYIIFFLTIIFSLKQRIVLQMKAIRYIILIFLLNATFVYCDKSDEEMQQCLSGIY